MSVTSQGEASVMEVPQGPPEQKLSIKTAQPTVVPLGALNSCAHNTGQALPLWVPDLEGGIDSTVTGMMALPQVAFKKATWMWDLCAGPENRPGYCYPVRGAAAKGAIPQQQKLLTSREVLRGLRNQYDIDRIKALLDRPGPAYSCAILGYGALGCTVAAAAALFKLIWGTEVRKPMRGMWMEVCATPCYGDTDKKKWRGGGRPRYVKSSTKCKTFSSGGLQLGLDSPERARYLKQVKTIIET